MTQSLPISDDLYALILEKASQFEACPPGELLEYWARVGASLEAVGATTAMKRKLLNTGILEPGGRPIGKWWHLKDSAPEEVAMDAETLPPESPAPSPQWSAKDFRIVKNPKSKYSKPGKGW